ncbi:MAG: glycosyltransferase family 1 protein, partial [Bacteroidetes bacterium]
MKAKKKKICFVVSSPFTAKAFLLNHFKVLANKYDIFLIANFEDFDKNAFLDTPLVGVQNIAIHRDISLVDDIKALLSLRAYFKKMQFDAVHS